MVHKFVLIDDDPEDIEFMFEAVRSINVDAECLMYLDPCEAVTALRSRLFIPELVVIDLTMPNLSGLDCLKQLKNLEYLNAVKFVMYSSAVPTKKMLDLLTPFGVGAFQKPSSIKDLSIIMSKLMVQV